jgi:hypothetical protein
MTKIKIALSTAFVLALASSAGAMTVSGSHFGCAALNHQYSVDFGGVPSSAYATRECDAAPRHKVLSYTAQERAQENAAFRRSTGSLN